MEPEHISTIVIRVISKLRQKLPIVNQRSLGEKGAYMDKQIVMQGGLHQPPHKWTPVEIVFLLKYYPKYKSGNSNYNACWIRGHLKSRSLTARLKTI